MTTTPPPAFIAENKCRYRGEQYKTFATRFALIKEIREGRRGIEIISTDASGYHSPHRADGTCPMDDNLDLVPLAPEQAGGFRFFQDERGYRYKASTNGGQCFKMKPGQWQETAVSLQMLLNDIPKGGTIETTESGEPL
jgi:hypothetical protein